jgi:hypothetical protein
MIALLVVLVGPKNVRELLNNRHGLGRKFCNVKSLKGRKDSRRYF